MPLFDKWRTSNFVNPTPDSVIGQVQQPAATPAPPPAELSQQKTNYDQQTAEYNNLLSDYERQVRGLDYANQAHTRTSSLWDQLEQQRQAGSPYGGNRFYSQGEIYQYDPTAGTYRGSISNQMIGAPQPFQTPQLTMSDPGDYETYMAEDPYFQYLASQQAAPPPLSTEPTKTVRPPSPGWGWIWRNNRWVRVASDK